MTNNPIISAFITNLREYNEGVLVGEWYDFPTTKEEIMQTFEEIGIDGIRSEEFFITDYDTSITGLHNKLSMYESIDELNYLASKIDDMSEYDIEKFEGAIELGDYCDSLKDFINLTENLDCFDYLAGVEDDYDLGYYWLEESGCYNTESMGHLSNYIDYERYGRDISLDENGMFTNKGYIRNNGNTFHEKYDGVSVPDEHKVFAIPKPKAKVLKHNS